MSIRDLTNKKICLLGLGSENQAFLRFLLSKGMNGPITICDRRSREGLEGAIKEFEKRKNINWQLGEKIGKRNLEGFEVLLQSPGGPLDAPDVRRALKKGAVLSSPMELFLEWCPSRNTIGVTGSKGKGTTSSLIAAILKKGGERVWLGGNIGVAPFGFLGKIRRGDWVVLELSSFQLENLKTSPRVAVITNFYKEHLSPADPDNPNYHKSLKAYWEAKWNVVKWQRRGDYAIINSKLKDQRRKLFQIQELRSKTIYFTKSDLKSKLIGEHNKENIAAAVEVAKIADIKEDIIRKAVAGFEGLEHRLEFAAENKGVRYYNDTFSTTPDSTIIALRSFPSPIILLAGGADKGADFSELAREMKERVKFAVLLRGQATPRLRQALLDVGFKNFKLAGSMPEAVAIARKEAAAGDIVLLSPACASFGMFKNYKERGKLFKEEVKR